MSYKWIRASELGDYLYCHRSWWLKQVRGVKSRNVRQLQSGTRHHQHHGRMVQGAVWMRKAAYILLFCVVAFVVFRMLVGG